MTVAPIHQRFVVLDGMRGVAALAVVVYHLGFFLPTGQHVPGGYLAVDFFFGLSGMVIGYSYGGRLRAGLGLARFMTLRYLRLYPLFLAGICFGLAGLVRQLYLGKMSPVEFGSSLLNVAMLPSVLTAHLYPINDPTWSLFFELIANGLFAVLARRSGSAAAGWVALLAGPFFVAAILRAGSADLGWEWSQVHYGTARVVFSFFLGAFLVRFCTDAKQEFGPATLVLPAILLVWLCLDPSNRAVYDIVLVVVGFPLLLLLGGRVQSRRLAPAFTLLGEVSYAVYVIHAPIVGPAAKTMSAHGYSETTILLVVPAAVLVLGFALVKLFDIPVRRALSGRWTNAPAAGAGSLAS